MYAYKRPLKLSPPPLPAKPIHGDYEALFERIVGQDEALEKIVEKLRLIDANLHPANRPALSALLLGPTGTGKTYTPEVLAKILHGDERNVFRIDCAEFQMEHEVCKLTGAPPGYLGHRETQPLLTQNRLNAITTSQCNKSIVVFDEIEKAAQSVFQLLLGILDKGLMQTGDNNRVSFERCIIFLTSNLGIRELKSLGRLGFHSTVSEEAKRKTVIAATKRHFSPEFLNRLDEILVYKELTRENIRQILEKQEKVLENFLNERLHASPAITLGFTEEAREWIIENGYSAEYGVRELRRLLERTVLGQIAKMTPGTFGGKAYLQNNRLVVDVSENQLKVSAVNAV